MEKHQEILSFIARFKDPDPKALEYTFLNQNCYWFAVILKQRFGGNVEYLPITGHFVCKIGNRHYDITGEILPTEPILPFDDGYEMEDKSHYDRIWKQCVLLKENDNREKLLD